MTDSRFDREQGFELASFKALGEEPTGEFEALVSVFGNVDYGGDRVNPGAFTKSLGKWRKSGDPIPVIWNHMWDQPDAHIGYVDPKNAQETKDGLLVKGRLDIADNPLARQVFRLLSQRRVKEFSFGYNVIDRAAGEKGITELLELDVVEVGPTLKGMNPATELLAVKSLAAAVTEAPPEPEPTIETKAGARHSKETLSALRRLRSELDALIGDPADGEPKSTEAEAPGGKASDLDADLLTRIYLMKEDTSADRT